jgi:3-keto-L-gulonate-6-phosphate decarboxylase
LPLPKGSGRILIEAGTPSIKWEGMTGIKAIRKIWNGHVVADLKR